MKKFFKNKKVKTVLIILLCLAIAGIIAVLSLNAYVVGYAKDKIITEQEALELDDVDCIIVLGCWVDTDGQPSDILRDRLTVGIDLFNKIGDTKILMSGDHGRTDYNEVGAMKEIALESGVPSSAVFMDHAGFSTYETMYRAKEVFEVKKAIIVTQEYHLYRAVYIANKLGIEAYGVSADIRSYASNYKREAREVLARDKDFFYVLLDVKPTYLGDVIPISGDGNATND